MGFGHRVYRAEDPRARVLRRTAKRARRPAGRGRRGARGGGARRAPGPQARPRAGDQRRVLVGRRARLRRGSARAVHADVHLRADRRLVGAHPRAEARGTPDPPDRQVRRAAAAAAVRSDRLSLMTRRGRGALCRRARGGSRGTLAAAPPPVGGRAAVGPRARTASPRHPPRACPDAPRPPRRPESSRSGSRRTSGPSGGGRASSPACEVRGMRAGRVRRTRWPQLRNYRRRSFAEALFRRAGRPLHVLGQHPRRAEARPERPQRSAHPPDPGRRQPALVAVVERRHDLARRAPRARAPRRARPGRRRRRSRRPEAPNRCRRHTPRPTSRRARSAAARR